MSVPDWATSGAGSKIRVALWLVTEVGVGGAFTKAQLRDAFPSIEQIDRRMRDLRAEGWVIATYREDRSLAPDELRLVAAGGHVWEAGYRSRPAPVTERDRRSTLAADDYLCRYCGVGPGEPYPDDPLRTAKLSVAVLPGKNAPHRLTLCDRCLPSPGTAERSADVLEAVQALDSSSLESLRSWVARRERPRTPLELLWARYRRLPVDARHEVERFFEGRLTQDPAK